MAMNASPAKNKRENMVFYSSIRLQPGWGVNDAVAFCFLE